jgi:hypothetical protein
VLTVDTKADILECETCVLVYGATMPRPPRHADFIRVWTPEMAYVLGYWWADGCMRIKRNTGAHEIEIASNDVDHLQTIAAAIGGNYSLRKVSATGNTYAVSFCSKEMYYDVLTLGGTPSKSRTIGFPPIPSELLAHFVRGVVDGDGTLTWNDNRPIIHIYSGSKSFLEGVVTTVQRETGIPAPHITANRQNWTVKWSTVRAKCLAAWLYVSNPGLALQRKAALVTNFLTWQPKKRPERGTITDEMRQRFGAYLPSEE